MKRNIIYPLLLALTLTGCQSPASVPEPSETAAETTAESTSETAAETTAEAAPVSNEAAYAFIRDMLIPQYGLSKPWTVIQPITYQETGFTCEDLPAEAQGIISAVVQDFDGDGDPEIVILMQKYHSFILQLYCPFDGTYALCEVYEFLTYWDNTSYNPKLWIQDDLLILTNDSLTCDPAHAQDAAFTAVCQDMYLGDMPDVACVSAELTVLRVDGDDFEKQVVIRNTLTPSKETFSANGEEITCAVGEMDYDKTLALARGVLDNHGIAYDMLYTDWGAYGIPNVEPHNGLAINFTDAEPVFEISFGNQKLFCDYTDLYAQINKE